MRALDAFAASITTTITTTKCHQSNACISSEIFIKMLNFMCTSISAVFLLLPLLCFFIAFWIIWCEMSVLLRARKVKTLQSNFMDYVLSAHIPCDILSYSIPFWDILLALNRIRRRNKPNKTIQFLYRYQWVDEYWNWTDNKLNVFCYWSIVFW